MSAAPAEPANSLRMPDGRCGMCGGDWSVCGCQGMVNRSAQPSPTMADAIVAKATLAAGEPSDEALEIARKNGMDLS